MTCQVKIPTVTIPMPGHGGSIHMRGTRCSVSEHFRERLSTGTLPLPSLSRDLLCKPCQASGIERVPAHDAVSVIPKSAAAILRNALCLALLAVVFWIGLAPEAGAIPPIDVLENAAATELGAADLTVADGIVDRFKAIIQNMEETAGIRARQLLYLLFSIDLVISIGRGIHMQEDLGAMMSRFVFRLGVVTIISLFIGHASEFVDWIATVAITLGQEASGSEATTKPSMSAIFGQGWDFAGQMIAEVSIWKPISVFYIVTAFFILLITGIMMALLLTVHIEMFVVALGGLIVLGFAGLETTKDSATSYFKTLIGKGFKMMGLLMIFAMMNKIILEVAGAGSYSLGLELVLTIMILQLVQVVLMLTVPSSLENLAGGIGASRAAEVIAGVAVAFAAAPLAKAAIGASAAGAAGGLGGAVAGMLGAKGGGAGTMAMAGLKGAGGGAMKSAARYGGAGALPGQSLRGTLAQDLRQMLGKNQP